MTFVADEFRHLYYCEQIGSFVEDGDRTIGDVGVRPPKAWHHSSILANAAVYAAINVARQCHTRHSLIRGRLGDVSAIMQNPDESLLQSTDAMYIFGDIKMRTLSKMEWRSNMDMSYLPNCFDR